MLKFCAIILPLKNPKKRKARVHSAPLISKVPLAARYNLKTFCGNPWDNCDLVESLTSSLLPSMICLHWAKRDVLFFLILFVTRLIVRSNEQGGRQLHWKNANFIKITDSYCSELWNCIEEKQSLRQWTGG